MKNRTPFDIFDEPLSLSDAQVAALARPGESWDQAHGRAQRLYTCVIECHPCPVCNPTGLDQFGWIDNPGCACESCEYRANHPDW